MKRFTIPALVAGVCSLAIALPQPQQGQSVMGTGLQGPGTRGHVPAPRPQLTEPIVHQGIPGDRIVDGIYVERRLGADDRVHDFSLGTLPILPVEPDVSSGGTDDGGYLTGCPCPVGARAENEPDCGLPTDTTNGGCNSAPEVYSPIKLGDVICGTTAKISSRDTDWYETVLTTETTVAWTVSGDFLKFIAILDAGPGCGSITVVGSDLADGCGNDAVVSATLPAGTYWFFVAIDFSSPDLPCGTSYTATLTGGCEIYTSAAAFDAAHPALTVEDFEDTGIAPGGLCGPTVTPWDSTTSNPCLDPGEIASGLTIEGGQNLAWLAGLGYGAGDPLDSIAALGYNDAGFTSFITELTFTPPVRNVGVELEPVLVAGSATIDVFGVGGGLILSRTETTVLGAPTFFGVACDEPIERVVVSDNNEGTFVDNIRFGGTGDCEFITNETQFNTRFPGLALENFEGIAGLPALDLCIDAGPWDSTTSNACIAPGDIEPGLTMFNPAGGHCGLVALGYTCGFDPIDSDSYFGPFGEPTAMSFDPPVTRVGFDYETCLVSSQNAVVDVFGPGAVLISSTPIEVTDVHQFLGIACDGLIESVVITSTVAASIEVDNIRFGTGCQLITDGDDFDSLYPDLAFEDFEGSGIPPTNVCCDAEGWDSTTANVCIAPGFLEPGITLTDPAGTSVCIVGIGYGGAPGTESDMVVGGTGATTAVSFSPPVRQVGLGMQVVTFGGGPGSVEVTLFGTSGEVLSQSELIVADETGPQTFAGFACDEPIGSMTVIGLTALTFIDNLRFGTSKLLFERFCVEESVASVNTGLKTKMLLETQDGAGNLLPFDQSIAGNGSPNRLMMIAKDAPGLGNGGVTNIGYFIMGTGSNTFVPPGSIGPICVAPGIKRYLPPTSMTSETIVFHDAGGTPTTLVAQGFSRVALGAGAHPIGANIGGVLGFHWSFQAWHRDTPGDSNLSDAVAVDFVP